MTNGRHATGPGSLFAADSSVATYLALNWDDTSWGAEQTNTARPGGLDVTDPRTVELGTVPGSVRGNGAVPGPRAGTSPLGSDIVGPVGPAPRRSDIPGATTPPVPGPGATATPGANGRPSHSAGSRDAFSALRSLNSGRPAEGDPRLDAAPDRWPAPASRPTGASGSAARVSPAALVSFLLFAAVTVIAHVGAAWLTAARVATAGEAQLAVAALAARSQTGSAGPLALTDRFAALQIAVVQLLLPAGDPVDTARWACLGLGAVTTLLLWPVLRRLELPVPAVAVAVALMGLTYPVLILRGSVSAAPAAALWLTLAAALATRDRWRTALLFTAVAVATAPLAAAALLALAAHLVLDGTVRTSARPFVGGALGVATVAVAVLAVGSGPLAGTGGPDVPTAVAVAGAAVALLLVAMAAATSEWLRPALSGALPLVAVLLVPGPSRATAGLLVLPLLAVAVAVLGEQVRARGKGPLAALVAAVLVLIVAPMPAAVAKAGSVPVSASLAEWVAAQAGPDTVVVADPLDRAALLAAGVPAGRLRTPDDPAVPSEVRVVSDRPGGTGRACPAALVLAATPRGSGGAPGVVCETDAASMPESGSPARVRFGGALADNPGLDLGPSARAELRSGDVDARLMLTLAALTGAHHIGIADFPAVPLDAAAIPRRQVVLTTFDGTPAAASALLRNWLGAQQSPFVPSRIRQYGPNLVIAYPLPAPTGLLSS